MGGRSWSDRIQARHAALTLVGLVLVGAGCGGSSKSSSDQVVTAGQIDSGQVDLRLPPGWKQTKNGPVRTAAATGAAAASGAKSGSDDTIPLAQQNPTTKFFGALSSFQSCLAGLHTKFIGVPDAANPSSPANNPDYIKALSTCAAKSNIVQALKDEQSAQENLTPAEVQTQNKGFLEWRKCMIGRGWGIPEPKPDSKGLLASIGSTSAASQYTPPPGKDLLSSSDLQECASVAQNKVAPSAGG
jgi:hypothetical protein